MGKEFLCLVLSSTELLQNELLISQTISEHRRQSNGKHRRQTERVSLRDEPALCKHTFVCVMTSNMPVSAQAKSGETMISVYCWEGRCTVLDDNTLLSISHTHIA